MMLHTLALIGSAVLTAGPPSGLTGDATPMHRFEHLRLVVLDPGHGGHNTGCLGVDGSYEKVAVLSIAKKVERILTEETSAAVMLTRRDDSFLGLGERSARANQWGADVFLSLHLNADPYARGSGVEAWFLATSDDTAGAGAASLVAREEQDYGESDTVEAFDERQLDVVLGQVVQSKARQDSEALAYAVAKSLWKRTRAIYRGVKQARFGVLKAARMPSIVVEGGFLSHQKEGWKLVEDAYQDKIARAIVDGLIDFDRSIGGRPPRQLSSL